jgi:hypothetical protein
MISIELSLLTAVALFCSTFSSSALVSVVLTVGIFVAGLISTDLRHFTDLVVVSPVVGYIVSGIGWVLPAFRSSTSSRRWCMECPSLRALSCSPSPTA